MEKQTVKKVILDYLSSKSLVFEGTIEDDVGRMTGAKGDTISRILRYMFRDGYLIKDFKETVDGKKYLAYGKKQEAPFQSVLF